MRFVVEHPDEATERAQRGRAHVLLEHGLDARARFVAERFESAQSHLASEVVAAPIQMQEAQTVGTDADPPLVALARQSPDVDTPSSHPRAARLFRRTILRILRHRDEQQRQLDLALAMGVEHVAHMLNVVRGEVGELRGRTDRLGNEARLLGKRLEEDEAKALAESDRTRQVLSQLADRLASLDHFNDEVQEAIELIEKDVSDQGGELDILAAQLRRPLPPLGEPSEGTHARTISVEGQ